MKQPSIMRSSAAISVLLHVVLFGLLGIGFASCTGPVERGAEAPAHVIQAAAVEPREVETYYRERRERERERLQAREREQRKRLEQERRRAEAAAQQRQARQKREQAAEAHRQALLQKEKREAAEARRLQEQVKRNEAERERKEREARAERQRKEQEARRKAEQERQRKEQEARRKAEEQRQRKEQEARRKAEQERQRKEQEARRLAEEQRRLIMRKRQRALWTRQYAGLLRASIERQWKKPPRSVRGGDCVLKLRQDEDGTVLDLNVVSCDGDLLFVRSVEEAVWKASPLPAPPSSEVFDADVELTFRQKY